MRLRRCGSANSRLRTTTAAAAVPAPSGQQRSTRPAESRPKCCRSLRARGTCGRLPQAQQHRGPEEETIDAGTGRCCAEGTGRPCRHPPWPDAGGLRGDRQRKHSGRRPKGTEGTPRRCRMTPTTTGRSGVTAEARTRRSSCRYAALGLIALAITSAAGLAACSSSPAASRPPASTSSTTDPTAAVRNAILSAWTAAETALYQAAAEPNGATSPALDATMSGQQLELVKGNSPAT